MEEVTTFALLTGTVTDAVTGSALTRSALGVTVAGDAVWARVYDAAGFVIVADAGRVKLGDPSSAGPDPKHLTGAFSAQFTLTAPGYSDLPVTLHCDHDAIPIVAAYALMPGAFAIRGRVTTGNPPVAAAGVSVDIMGATPPIAIPAPAVTAADGTYAIPVVPAVQSLTLGASGHTQTVEPAFPVLTVNFAL